MHILNLLSFLCKPALVWDTRANASWISSRWRPAVNLVSHDTKLSDLSLSIVLTQYDPVMSMLTQAWEKRKIQASCLMSAMSEQQVVAIRRNVSASISYWIPSYIWQLLFLCSPLAHIRCICWHAFLMIVSSRSSSTWQEGKLVRSDSSECVWEAVREKYWTEEDLVISPWGPSGDTVYPSDERNGMRIWESVQRVRIRIREEGKIIP